MFDILTYEKGAAVLRANVPQVGAGNTAMAALVAGTAQAQAAVAVKSICKGHFCVHYVSPTPKAWAETTWETLEHVWGFDDVAIVTATVVDAAGETSVITFGQLGADSHRYARALQGLGVGPGDRVATGTPKPTDMALMADLAHDVGHASSEALRMIGVVFQQRTLDLDLSVIQNLTYHAALHGIGKHDGRARADEVLTRIALSDRANDKVRNQIGRAHV